VQKASGLDLEEEVVVYMSEDGFNKTTKERVNNKWTKSLRIWEI